MINQEENMSETVLDRFLRYVKIDTQSQEGVPSYPSTEKQKDLSSLLVEELKAIGLEDAAMDQWGYVMATLPSNLDAAESEKVPTIGLLGHVDTSPDVSGKDVKPAVFKNYQGGDIVLPGDSTQVILESDNPELKRHIGDDIVTSDGRTLLGADDKAGIAEILTALEWLVQHPEVKHGKIRVGFTPDEETGRGTEHFDVKVFDADVAYTLDGSSVGEIENETFNAAAATFTVGGINVHPGYAKDKLVNAVRIAAEIVKQLEQDPAPESTEKREGYLHPHGIEGNVEKTSIRLLIRDFDEAGMQKFSDRLRQIRDDMAKKYPKANITVDIQESYKNMKVKLDEDPRVVDFALEAVRRVGLEPGLEIIRGGTDGARLCFMGLPTPNIFAGGQNFHSKIEWVPVQAMEKAVETVIQLVQIWTEKTING